MTTIVMNTKTGAVTEYDWVFNSITPAYAASSNGLYSLAGSDDAGVAIAATLRSGVTLLGSGLLKVMELVFFAIVGGTTGRLRVFTDESTEYTYAFAVQGQRMSRAKPGLGLRSNYFAVGFSNVGGADFRIDQIDVDVFPSRTRRTA